MIFKQFSILIQLVDVAQDVAALLKSIEQRKNPNVAPLARKLFTLIPGQFKAPRGPATEEEFINAVFEVFRLFTRQTLTA